MAPIILIPLQVALVYAGSKIVGAIGDTTIVAATKTVRAAGAVFERGVASLEEKAAKKRIDAAKARIDAVVAEQHADDVCGDEKRPSKEDVQDAPWEPSFASA